MLVTTQVTTGLTETDLARALARVAAFGLPPQVSPALASPPVLAGDSLRPLFEHTLLKPTATGRDIDRLCDEAIEHRLGGVCVNPLWCARAAERLSGTGVRTVTVIGFPLGAVSTAEKVAEALAALDAGADELDMVADLGALRAADLPTVYSDVRAVVDAARPACVKVIIEAGLLQRDEKIIASVLAVSAGAAFVKTSTGYAFTERDGAYVSLGATVHDVSLLRAVVGDAVGVKASGGIRTADQARALVAAGATRLGTSASVDIVTRG